MLRTIGRARKLYQKKVKGRKKEAIPKQCCPYVGCRCQEVWYWGWYERQEGSIPFGDEEIPVDPIDLRRFLCRGCGKTFSYRPPFLLFGRRLAALTYQRLLKGWCTGTSQAVTGACWELGEAGRKAFRHSLTQRCPEALERLKEWLQISPSQPAPGASPRERLWLLARQLVKRVHRFQLPIHLVCIALARHPDGTRYAAGSS